jgi:hypothetical protein
VWRLGALEGIRSRGRGIAPRMAAKCVKTNRLMARETSRQILRTRPLMEWAWPVWPEIRASEPPVSRDKPGATRARSGDAAQEVYEPSATGV